MPDPAAGAAQDEDVDVLSLAGQRPGPAGEWLLITAADGAPRADFLAWILDPGARHAHGGDVLLHLAADTTEGEPLTLRVSVWAVLGGLLVPVAAWDRQDPDGWPERIRATAAFAMSMMTELGELGGDLGAGQQVHLDATVLPAAAGFPAGITATAGMQQG